MSSRETSNLSSKEVLIQEVFQPGNLVWGGKRINEDRFHDLCIRGILPAKAHRQQRHAFRDYAVCFSMLSNSSVDNQVHNYNNAQHDGPKVESDYEQRDNIAIVVSCTKLVNSYTEQLKAIGDVFRLHPEKYTVDASTNTVAGIPIDFVPPYSVEPYDDEIIVNYIGVANNEIRGITPECWLGFVAFKSTAETWKKRIEKENINLPLFSPTGEIL